jgi:hypothetical protein
MMGRPLSWVILGLVLTAGCSSKSAETFAGTRWHAATDRELTFHENHVLTYVTGGKPRAGRYFLNATPNTVTITMDQGFAGSAKQAEQARIDGDTLTMEDTDGTTLTFRRR